MVLATGDRVAVVTDGDQLTGSIITGRYHVGLTRDGERFRGFPSGWVVSETDCVRVTTTNSSQHS